MVNQFKHDYKINKMNTIKLFSIAILLCLIVSLAKAQTKQVQGTVRDDQGPLPGISVIEKGMPNNGIATDVDGKFKITLKGTSGVLIIKGIGYETKEVNITGRSSISVTLTAANSSLQEIIVNAGYVPQKKITLTGATSAVSGKEIRQNPSASLQNTLAGRITGYISQQRSGRPGADGADFLIRGLSSYTNNNQPLIIVDDIEFTYDQFQRLDANEVETVTILKDASTTAIYGIKGANGVVVLTTRRGVVGSPKISLRTDYSLSQPTKLPKFLDAYNTALLYNQAQINDNKYAATPNPTFTPKWTDQDLALFQNGQDPYGHPNIDWYHELFKKYASQSDNHLDITGGTEKVTYFVSVGYLNQGGNLRDFSHGQGYDGNYYNNRYNYRSNLDIKVSPSLKLKLDVYGNINEVNSPNIFNNTTVASKNDPFYEYGAFLGLSPFAYPIKNPDGSWGYSTWQKTDAGGASYNGGNIIERLTLGGYNRYNENNMNIVTSAEQKLDFLTKGLAFKGTLSYASSYGYSKNLTRTNMPSAIYTLATDTYQQTDPNIFRLEPLGLNYSGTNFSNGNTTIRTYNVQALLTYDRAFKNHHFTGLALMNQTSKNNYVNDANYNFIPANTLGYTGRLGYDYKQKYLLQLTGAYNGTDRFVSSKRFGFFPAVSAGWNIAEEPFVKNNFKALDQFKIRASYGLVGSDNLGGFTYSYLQTYSVNNPFGQPNFGINANGVNGLQEGRLPNSQVTWEKQKELNIGLDFGLFNKINGTVDVFNNNRYDILSQRGTVSAIFGQDLPPVNLGRVNNKGFEIELNYHDKIGKDINYSLKGTYSYAHNTILYMDETSTQYPWQAITGHPIGSRVDYEFIGFYQDAADVANSPKVNPAARPGDLKYRDLNGDGIIDSKDQAVISYPNTPDTNFGLNFSFSYKNISLSALFQGALHFNVRAYEEAGRAFSSNLTAIQQQAWTPDIGDNAKYPALTLLRTVSDPGAFVSNYWNVPGDYLRLRTAQLSYSLPASWLNKVHIQSAVFYLNGNNLLTWSKAFSKYALDPEITSGTDRINYPPQRMYNAGLNITFN